MFPRTLIDDDIAFCEKAKFNAVKYINRTGNWISNLQDAQEFPTAFLQNR